ncbi:MAG: ATP phosphoribosyltransferase regulatory subunit [Sphingopyxis sp.]|nr:ATP phosphoribosyltransferase regulatory subunit [Sphingopyxis sp.]
MTNPLSLLPEGLRDRLPPQAEAASRVTRAMIDALRSHGYARVSPPLAEYRETLSGGDGAESGQDLLRFTDPVSQRTLAFRPDITRQVGRIAATLLAGTPRPLRLCYAGQVVKLRASQLRPAREMLQIGAELVGSESVAAAAEIVAIAIDALEAAGIGPVTVDFTLPDALERLAGPNIDRDRLSAIATALDGKDAGALTALDAAEWLPLLAATGNFASALTALGAFDTRGVLADQIAALETIAARIDGRARLMLDPTERHGFAYQSWFGFSLFVPGQGDAIGRGGTYHIDGSGEPAVGFSLYPDPLIDTGLGAETGAARRVFLPLGYDAAAAAKLRAEGWETVAALSDADNAAELGCSHVLGADGPVPL